MKNTLTIEELNDISRIAMDLETGNHLLYPRTKEYRKFMREVCEALDAENKTSRQFEITMEYNKCFYN